MTKEMLLEKIAPCSLMCHTCGAYEHGVIRQSAEELLKRTEGMREFYDKFDTDRAARFAIFEEELEKCSSGMCSGCRNKEHNICSIQGCFILDCTAQHHVDYCGECCDFPCDRATDIFEDEVYSQWLEGNSAIRESGIEQFWESRNTQPHYKAYIKPNI